MFGIITVAARDRKRLAEIMRVVSRYGLDTVLARVGAGSGLDDPDATSAPERTREALETLGPAFIKLGQILATRPDLLPPEWIAELEKLQSGARPLPFETLRGQVEAALGAVPETAFARFDTQPLAAGSIAQVHRAALPDGREVVVKIRRPDVRPKVEADLRLIAELARTAEGAGPSLARYQLRALVRQLSEALLGELDFTGEARNLERFAANFADRDDIVIPEAHWPWTSESLLVMDYVDGTPATDAARLTQAGVDPHIIASRGATAVLDMVLVHGLFHADPHPGNLMALPGDRIGLLDFGMVGHVSPRRRTELIGFVQALATADAERLAEVLADWTAGGVPRERISAAAEGLIARHAGGPLSLSALVHDMMGLMRREKAAMPADLALIFKALITIDGVLLRIDPEFDLSTAMKGAWSRVLLARHGPQVSRERLAGLMLDLSATVDDLPRLVRAAARRLSDDQDRAALEQRRALQMQRAVTRAGGWVAVSVFASGLMIAAALAWRG